MANFSIRLVKRNSMGNPIHGQWVEFETDSGAELADFYNKIVDSRPGKRYEEVVSKQPQKKKRKGKSNDTSNIPSPVGIGEK